MKKTELFLGFLIISLGIGLWILSRQTAEPAAAAHPQQKTPAIAETEVPLPAIVVPPPTPTPSANATNIQSPATTQASLTPDNQAATPAKEPLQDPIAREALALVGSDPDAEEYWLDAIFDGNLPDNERADLMEDLNEVGFADPKNLTPDDLSLIANRLVIIDALLADADDFMTEHLLEAQKDLVNMLATAPQQP